MAWTAFSMFIKKAVREQLVAFSIPIRCGRAVRSGSFLVNLIMALIMEIKKFTSIILLFLTLNSCSPYWYKPMGFIFNHVPKEGSPGFRLGWMHGCESGLGTQFGGAIYQSFYSWKRDPDIASSKKLKIVIKKN